MNKRLLFWLSITTTVIVIAVATAWYLSWQHNKAANQGGNVLAQRAYTYLTDKDNTIEYVKITMRDSTLETWHDPATNYSRSESKDLQSNIQNITIVKGDTVVQMASNEKKASVTYLSPKIVGMNEYLQNTKQFDLLKIDLNSTDWTRLPDATVRGAKTYVIEHQAKGTIDSYIIMRLYLDQASLMPVRDELYKVEGKERSLVSNDDREYKLLPPSETDDLFNISIPVGYDVTESSSNEPKRPNQWINHTSRIFPISFSIPPEVTVTVPNYGTPYQALKILGPDANNGPWPWIEITKLITPPSGTLKQWIASQFKGDYSKIEDTKVAGLAAVYARHDKSLQTYSSEEYYVIYQGTLYRIMFLNYAGRNSDWTLYNKFLESVKFGTNNP